MIAMASAKEVSIKTGVFVIRIHFLIARDGWGLPQVDMRSVWEYVKVILHGYTLIFVPNLYSTSFLLMYTDVLRWTIIPAPKRSPRRNYC